MRHVLGSESNTRARGATLPQESSPFHLLAVSSNGGAMTKLLGPEVSAKRQEEEAVGSCSGSGLAFVWEQSMAPVDVQGYEEDGSEAVRALPDLLRATAALMVSPHLSPTPLQTGIPRHRAAENCQRLLLALNPTPRQLPSRPKSAALC